MEIMYAFLLQYLAEESRNIDGMSPQPSEEKTVTHTHRTRARMKFLNKSSVSILHTIHKQHVMCNGASEIVQFVK